MTTVTNIEVAGGTYSTASSLDDVLHEFHEAWAEKRFMQLNGDPYSSGGGRLILNPLVIQAIQDYSN
jgi:hypothetical protein